MTYDAPDPATRMTEAERKASGLPKDPTKRRPQTKADVYAMIFTTLATASMALWAANIFFDKLGA